MTSFHSELYRLAGYSKKTNSEILLSAERMPILELAAPETNTGYSCIFNWASMRYSFISDSIKSILGYDKSKFFETGLDFSLSIIHQADLQKIRELHLAIFTYYYNTPPQQRSKLRFSYNLRIITANNSIIHILRQSTFSGFTSDGKPILEYINSTDITSFGYHSHMVLTVDRLSAAGIYVKCYERKFGEEELLLSNRERQVLELARQGLTTKQIAQQLYLSVETVKSHRKHIIAKAGGGNITTAINRLISKSAL